MILKLSQIQLWLSETSLLPPILAPQNQWAGETNKVVETQAGSRFTLGSEMWEQDRMWRWRRKSYKRRLTRSPHHCTREEYSEKETPGSLSGHAGAWKESNVLKVSLISTRKSVARKKTPSNYGKHEWEDLSHTQNLSPRNPCLETEILRTREVVVGRQGSLRLGHSVRESCPTQRLLSAERTYWFNFFELLRLAALPNLQRLLQKTDQGQGKSTSVPTRKKTLTDVIIDSTSFYFYFIYMFVLYCLFILL